MDFRDRDGAPLIEWSDPEDGVRGLAGVLARGRPCDYTGLTYDKLRGGSGIQWPCNDEHPDGTERLYADGVFHDRPRRLRDLRPRPAHRRRASAEQEYRAMRPGRPGVPQGGRLRAAARGARRRVPAAADHRPHRLPLPHPHQDRPRAAAERRRARRLGRDRRRPTPTRSASREGDLVGSSRRAARSRRRPASAASAPGVVFVPFHYGYWDPDATRPGRPAPAANELTITDWDPVSKQPLFKTAACRVTQGHDGDGPHRRRPPPRPRPCPRPAAADGAAAHPAACVETPVYPNDPAQGTATAPTTTTPGGA